MKQLGCTHYVYPTATHTRFQHSLGVMHLAGEYYNHLIGSSTDLQFDAVDHQCVQIAGLVHDYVKCKYYVLNIFAFFVFILQQIMTNETYFLEYLSALPGPIRLGLLSKGCSLGYVLCYFWWPNLLNISFYNKNYCSTDLVTKSNKGHFQGATPGLCLYTGVQKIEIV